MVVQISSSYNRNIYVYLLKVSFFFAYRMLEDGYI